MAKEEEPRTGVWNTPSNPGLVTVLSLTLKMPLHLLCFGYIIGKMRRMDQMTCKLHCNSYDCLLLWS